IRRIFVKSSQRLTRVLGEDPSLEEMIALSDAAGLPLNEVIQALYNPELLLILARYQGTRHAEDFPVVPAAVIPPTCCSSFAAWGTFTASRALLIGRNLDYPLNGFYDRFPAVIYFEPPAPALRYMSFT